MHYHNYAIEGATMQDNPVMIREDVTISLDRDLIEEMLGIAEVRGITLSVLVRDVLGAFCRTFRSGTDWTRSDLTMAEIPSMPGAGTEEAGPDRIALLQSRVLAHDEMIASLQSRISRIESGAQSLLPPSSVPSCPGMTPAGIVNPPPGQSQISGVIDCDAPQDTGVSDEALVKPREPVSPVFTSVDISTLGRISPTQVYSQTEAAALLGISITTIRKYVKEKRIVSRKIGRSTVFQGQDLLAYSEQAR
jgi:excisionase family DNA binding protein